MSNINEPLKKESKERDLNLFWQLVVALFAVAGILLVMNNVFHFRVIFSQVYLYIVLGLFLPIVFIIYPPFKVSDQNSKLNRYLFYLDIFLFGLTLFICFYFARHGYNIVYRGWSHIAPWEFVIMAPILWILTIEAIRRTVGIAVSIVVIVFSTYPLVSGYMPGILSSIPRDFTTTALYHSLSSDSILGLPLFIFAQVMVGFILFGTLLSFTGAGDFFVSLAHRLLGNKSYGAPGKAAVISSAFLATMSGSVMSNVITSGSITIPAMKKGGFSSNMAGAVELCASTGGVLMPPVMGAVAFLMASVLGVPYSTIVIVAIVPSILFFFGLFVQVDGYAKKHNLTGFGSDYEDNKTKNARNTIFNLIFDTGWIYILAFAVLLYTLFYFPIVGRAPYYGCLVLMVLSMLRKTTRFDIQKLFTLIKSVSILFANIIPVMAGVGMVMGSLLITGVGPVLSRELVMLAGGNVIMLLIMGALASFILGTGLTTSVCYILLAITLAPSLITIGYNPLAVHLFIAYWGVLSYITPPVAIGAYPAASLSGGTPLRVALQATIAGGVIYIIPFWLIFEPGLIFQDASIFQSLYTIALAFLGVFIMASALSGYLVGVGSLTMTGKNVLISYFIRGLLVVSGLLLPVTETRLIGIGLFLIIIIPYVLIKKSFKTGNNLSH